MELRKENEALREKVKRLEADLKEWRSGKQRALELNSNTRAALQDAQAKQKVLGDRILCTRTSFLTEYFVLGKFPIG